MIIVEFLKRYREETNTPANKLLCSILIKELSVSKVDGARKFPDGFTIQECMKLGIFEFFSIMGKQSDGSKKVAGDRSFSFFAGLVAGYYQQNAVDAEKALLKIEKKIDKLNHLRLFFFH